LFSLSNYFYILSIFSWDCFRFFISNLRSIWGISGETGDFSFIELDDWISCMRFAVYTYGFSGFYYFLAISFDESLDCLSCYLNDIFWDLSFLLASVLLCLNFLLSILLVWVYGSMFSTDTSALLCALLSTLELLGLVLVHLDLLMLSIHA
jgi:hypothetical protein